MPIVIGYVLGLTVGVAAALLMHAQTTPAFAQIMLRCFLPIGVGLPLVFSFVGHVLMSDRVAARLGWAAGSPFQKEVGFWDGASGVAALLCPWFGVEFWLAVIIFNAIFWFLAGGLHVHEVIRHKNFNFDNASTAIVDFLVPITLIVLFALSA